MLGALEVNIFVLTGHPGLHYRCITFQRFLNTNQPLLVTALWCQALSDLHPGPRWE